VRRLPSMGRRYFTSYDWMTRPHFSQRIIASAKEDQA
jgi:hypothetical protein